MALYVFNSAAGQWNPHPRFAGAFVLPLITSEQNAGLTVWRVRLLPGAGIPPHTHPDSTETFLVLQGVALCCVGDVETEMKPGDMGYAPPGIEHRIRNLSDEPLEAISIFNPPL